jgi:hypothetical protein
MNYTYEGSSLNSYHTVRLFDLSLTLNVVVTQWVQDSLRLRMRDVKKHMGALFGLPTVWHL